MSFKPEDVRIPYLWEYYNEMKREPEKAPSMYDQSYVDALKQEIEYYKSRYRQLLHEKIRRPHDIR